MKHSLKIVLFVLLLCGVFGADEVKPESVMEGDSVTLTPDPAKIQGFVKLQWRFGEKLIAQTRRTESSIEYEDIFRGRLQLDHLTGSLTFKNMRTKHSGLYQLQIDYSDTVPSYIEFKVTVKESPSVDAIEFEMKSMSVMEGDPVTLHVPQIQGDELIVWRFGDEGKLIAKHDIENKSSPLYDEERFRDRLKLNDQIGSLTIMNTRTTDSGLYTVKISSNKQTLYKRFTLIVSAVPVPDTGVSSGPSPAAVAGIVVLLLAVAAAAAGVMYYLRPRITNLPNQMWTVMEGDDVPLNPDTEIQTGDEILWLFGDEDTLIAEIKGENREMKTYKGPDERFRDTLKLDEKTGSLTIKFIFTEHAGLYTLKIRRGRETLKKKFIVSVREGMRSVMEGDPVLLNPDTEIQKDYEVQWLFGDKEQTVLAEIKNTEVTEYAGTDERFRDGLKLDEETGSLTITNSTAAHTGYYTLKITRDKDKIYKRFYILVKDKVEEISLAEGDSVTLNPDTEIQREDQILWMFGDQDKLIAQMKGGTVDDDVNKRFRGRLELDKMTGSLTITKIEAEHTGLYKLMIISSSGGILVKRFKVSLQQRNKIVTVGDSVHLQTGLTEIQTDDEIEWRFGKENSLIAEIKGGTGETHDVPDERFRDRLKLDKKTGDLTINDSRDKHTGEYKLKICSSKGKTNMSFIVNIKASFVVGTPGESVRLYTGLNEIQTDDEIQWRFGDENSLIAEIKGGTGVTHDGPDERFRDRLELDEKTGDLIIKNSTAEHTGEYKLKICSSEGKTNSTYIVNIKDALVTNEAREKSSMKEKNDSRRNRVNESATVVMPLLNGEDVDVVNEEEGTSSL